MNTKNLAALAAWFATYIVCAGQTPDATQASAATPAAPSPAAQEAVVVATETETAEAVTPQGVVVVQTQEGVVVPADTPPPDTPPPADSTSPAATTQSSAAETLAVPPDMQKTLSARDKRDRNGGYRHISAYAQKANAAEKHLRDTAKAQGKTAPKTRDEPAQWNLPYGNFGVNAATNAINDAQSDVYNKTGITPFFNYYGTYLTNPYGGDAQGGNYTQMLQFGLGMDMEKIANWKGATITVSGMYDSGANLSNKMGNFFTASNTYVNNGVLMYEAYLNQEISVGSDTLNIMLGRMAMSDVFASLPMFVNVISGGIDCTPEAIYSNSPYQSMPVALWGGVVQYTHEDWQFAVGAYQTPASLADSDYHGTDWGFHSDAGYMLMAQLQWSPTFNAEMKDGQPVANTGLPGVYQVGAYYARDLPTAIEISYGDAMRDNVYGFYVQGQQMVWRDSMNPNRALTLWGGMQYAPLENVAIMPLMFFAGVQMQAVIPQRDQDSVFLSWMYGSFSSAYSNWNATQGGASADYEQVVELSYLITLNANVSLQPVVQYIMRPYGDPDITDALVIGAQVNVSF